MSQLYRISRAFHNSRKHQHIDAGGLGAQKCTCACVHGRPGGQHIVHQHDPAALDLRLRSAGT